MKNTDFESVSTVIQKSNIEEERIRNLNNKNKSPYHKLLETNNSIIELK